VFVAPRVIPALGERRAILLGLSTGLVGFLGNAFVPQGWMVYVVLTFPAFQGLVYPSMNSTLSKAVPANEQGGLQGGVATRLSMSAIIGPLRMTQALAFFTREGAPAHVPGAPFGLAGALTIVSMLIVVFMTRRVFARRST